MAIVQHCAIKDTISLHNIAQSFIIQSMLSYKITDEVTKKLKNLGELTAEKAAFLKSLPEENAAAIHRYARISTIGSSTRIENAILTDTEIDWMDKTLLADGRPTAFLKEKKYIEDKLSKERERSIEEVAGCRAMLSIIYSQAEELFPLSETTVKGLHKELLQYYLPASRYLGRYKIAPNSVVEMIEGTNVKKDVLRTSDPGPVTEAAMRDLIDWYDETLPKHPWPIAVVSEFVFRFLAIHPFQDGNGRLSRGLFLMALLQSGDKNLKTVIPCIAVDRHIEKNREEYYLVLRKCSEGKFSQDPRNYKIDYFLNFILKMLDAAIGGDADFYNGRYESYVNLAGAPRKVLNCFRENPEEKLGISDVLKRTDLPRRTAIYAINTLIDAKFLQKYGRGPSTKYQLTF